MEMRIPEAPLYRDPVYDGAADPTIVWNREEKQWWIVYTQRRANVDAPGVAYGHGTDIGIASSPDGHNFRYRGVLQGLEFERGRNSFWAPEVIWGAGCYHMYVSYVPGMPSDWWGPHRIVHMTSSNLWDWRFESVLPLVRDDVIDACVHQLPNGRWRMWYKDGAFGGHTYAADSDDLYNWTVVGEVIADCAHEGPNVFHWQSAYWMITDPWRGLAVYRSDDCEAWVRQEGNILVEPGTRRDDGFLGDHADILVQGDDAYIVYFVHPERGPGKGEVAAHDVEPYATRRTSIQVAKLEIENGRLVCDRDKPFHFELQPGA